MAFTETDRRLLSRCLSRESGAWEEFVDRFVGVFHHVVRHTAHCRSVSITPHDIEDVCAEIFLTLLKKDFAVLRHFKGNSSLSTYLAVVGRRIAVKAIAERRKSEELGHVKAHAANLGTLGVAPGIERIVNADEVRSMLNQLPASEAAVVRLFHMEGKSYRDISRELNVPENSIGPTLSRARDRMSQRAAEPVRS